MANYTSQVLINVVPQSSYVSAADASSSLVIKWNYPNCEKSWFRVAGTCFQPPPKDGCPPYPNPGMTPPNCFVEDFTLTNLFNSGLSDDRDPLAACSEDRHSIILPSQYPFVVNQSTLPPGLTLPTSDYQYIGVACNGSVPAATSYTFRFFFVCPDNVAPSTLEIEVFFDSPNEMLGISINGESTGLSASAPLIAKGFLLAGLFRSDVNFIDVTLQTPSTPDPGYMVLMARFTSTRACVSNGNFPPGVNTGCRVNLISNVLACDSEDVCRILKARGVVFPIDSIKKITSTSLDYNCYTDVTPTLQDCVECCDFLIDENLEDSWGMECGAIEEFKYTSNFSQGFSSSSKSRILFKYSPSTGIKFNFESDQDVSYGIVESDFNFSFSPQSILRRPDWELLSEAAISFAPNSAYASTNYQFNSSVNFSFMPKSLATPKTKIRGSTKVSFRPNSSYESPNYYRSIVSLKVDPSSPYDVFGYHYQGQMKASFSPVSGKSSSSRKFVSSLLFSVVPAYKPRWRTATRPNVLFGPRSNYTVKYFGKTEASVSFSPKSSVPVSTAWSWIGDTDVSVRSLTTYISSDLGILETDFNADSEVTEVPVQFQDIPAPPIPTTIPSITIPGCCPLVLERLQFRHNLGSIPRLSNFLRRNGLTLPGQLVKGVSATFIPVTYSARQSQWTGSLYLEGLSPSEAGRESWNLSVEFGCATNWRIAIRLYRRSITSDGSFRLVVNYPATTVCPNQSGFQGFAAALSPTGLISVPTAINLVVNDEEDVAETVPSSILIQFSVETSGSQITFPSDLEKQLKAATSVLF